ncbi:unnamed protein product [Amoebophrya sp. A120]|nr:unnamed protein product [Amoebophrya sp. A120]|eukprot:GSA120T00000651001.1
MDHHAGCYQARLRRGIGDPESDESRRLFRGQVHIKEGRAPGKPLGTDVQSQVEGVVLSGKKPSEIVLLWSESWNSHLGTPHFTTECRAKVQVRGGTLSGNKPSEDENAKITFELMRLQWLPNVILADKWQEVAKQSDQMEALKSEETFKNSSSGDDALVQEVFDTANTKQVAIQSPLMDFLGGRLTLYPSVAVPPQLSAGGNSDVTPAAGTKPTKPFSRASMRKVGVFDSVRAGNPFFRRSGGGGPALGGDPEQAGGENNAEEPIDAEEEPVVELAEQIGGEAAEETTAANEVGQEDAGGDKTA